MLEPAWAEAVTAALKRWSTPSARLRIEITEDALMVDPDRALAVVRDLGEVGVGVSLDDFGTGYSSLGLLKQLAVDELKIDRTFVGNALNDGADAAIVQAVSGLGRQLGLRIVAEGIEDEATLRAVAEWGATLGAGLLHRPAAARRGPHRQAHERLDAARSVDGLTVARAGTRLSAVGFTYPLLSCCALRAS